MIISFKLKLTQAQAQPSPAHTIFYRSFCLQQFFITFMVPNEMDSTRFVQSMCMHHLLVWFFFASSSSWLWFNINITISRSHNMQYMHIAHVKKNQSTTTTNREAQGTHTYTPSYGKVRLWWCIALVLPWARERIYPCTCTLHTHSLTRAKHILSLFCWIMLFFSCSFYIETEWMVG